MKLKNFLAIFIAITTILLLLPTKNKNASAYISQASLSNTVVFLTFEQEGSLFEEGFNDAVYKMYESSAISVKNYLSKQSRGKINLTTNIAKAKDGNFYVRSSKSVNYYKPRYEWAVYQYYEINPEGYDNRYFLNGEEVSPTTLGAVPHVDGAYREQLLIGEIVNAIDVSVEQKTDLNGDGYADSLVIITDYLASSDWGSILWPHMSTSKVFSDAYLNNFIYDQSQKNNYKLLPILNLGSSFLYTYNVISANSILSSKVKDSNLAVTGADKELYNVGVLAHEFMHNLGLYDYYSYTDGAYESVGEFDVMGNVTTVPQNMLAYLRLKMGWLNYNDLLYINDSGSYSLPLADSTSGKVAAKIVLSNYMNTGEYFMAEFRSSSLATASNPYDNELLGDGLIIYRVNPSSAYINSKLSYGSVDYGNMYGKDEVYVYRVGKPKNTKKLSSMLGETYAMLNGENTVYTLDGGKYNMSGYGNADLNKNADNLVSDYQNSETALLYSNGTNSGIVFSNVVIDYQNKTVNFDVSLPEKQSSTPILRSNNVKLDRFYDGSYRVLWSSDVKDGKASVLVVRSTDRLKKQAKEGSTGITIEDFHNGKFGAYKTLHTISVPLAEKCIVLPELQDEALVFIAIESTNGNCAVRYVGCVQNHNDTFKQFLIQKIDPLYTIIGVAFIAIIVFVAIVIFSNKRKKMER